MGRIRLAPRIHEIVDNHLDAMESQGDCQPTSSLTSRCLSPLVVCGLRGEQFDLLRKEPERIEATVEELLRLLSIVHWHRQDRHHRRRVVRHPHPGGRLRDVARYPRCPDSR